MGWIVFGYIISVIYIFSILSLLVYGLVSLGYNIKCRKVQACKNDECKFRGYCKRTVLSAKEIADIKALISQLDD